MRNEFDDDYSTHTDAGRMDDTAPDSRFFGSVYQGSGSTYGGNRGSGADPGTVAWPPYGLTVRQLADGQKALAAYARWRLYGVGRDQYDQGDHQKCEDMDIARLILEARDEIADLVNYLTFIDLRLDRMGKAVLGK